MIFSCSQATLGAAVPSRQSDECAVFLHSEYPDHSEYPEVDHGNMVITHSEMIHEQIPTEHGLILQPLPAQRIRFSLKLASERMQHIAHLDE